jgi:hypothetical protein
VIDVLLGFVVGGVGGIVGIGAYLRVTEKRVNGIPCPHPMCRNMLPRQACLSSDGITWADEECSVCLGHVRFKSEYSAYSGLKGNQDRWIRISAPQEAK